MELVMLDGANNPCPHCQSTLVPGNRRTKEIRVNSWYCIKCEKEFYWIRKIK